VKISLDKLTTVFILSAVNKLLDAYLKSKDHGSATDLARKIGISPQRLYYYRHGKRKIPASIALKIENETGLPFKGLLLS
jgi:transcriptional regulator with XRE-family HTH domain